MDNTKECLILIEATLELHGGQNRSMGWFGITSDKNVGADMDGVLGEIQNGLGDGSC